MSSTARLSLVGFLLGAITLVLIPVLAAAAPDRAAAIVAANPDSDFDGCGTIMTPEEAARYLESLQNQGPTELGGPAPPYYIPIAAHIVRQSNGTGGLSASRLDDAIANANLHYLTTGMVFFQLGAIDYIDSDAWYTTDTLDEIDDMRTHNLVADAINIYFTENLNYESGGLCGISAFTFSSVQSIAMRNSCTANPDGLGNHSTFSHEIGHYFDLFHTHEPYYGDELVDGSNCDVAGDLVCDTPADPRLGSSNVDTGCSYFGTDTDGNGETYVPDPSQLMSYSLKHCRDNFSALSLDRALSTLLSLRTNLLSSAVGVPSIGAGGPGLADGLAIDLSSPRPNPTDGRTELTFSIDRAATVDVAVFDVRGVRVRTLVSGPFEAGAHGITWDGNGASGRAAAPGIYFLRMSALGEGLARKIQIIR